MDIIKELYKDCVAIFGRGNVKYAYTTIPTYPSGQIGFMVCKKKGGEGEDEGTGLGKALRLVEEEGEGDDKNGLPPMRYYSPEIHAASFVLPKFAADELN